MKFRILTAALALSAAVTTTSQAEVSFGASNLEKTTVYPNNPVNIQTSLSTLAMVPVLAVNVGLAPNLSVGLTGTYMSAKLSGFEGVSAAVQAQWFKSGLLNDSLYVKPSLAYSAIESARYDYAHVTIAPNQKAKIPNASTLVGYQWMWGSGFNINAGFGAAYLNPDNDIVVQPKKAENKQIAEYSSFTRGFHPAGELMLGYTF